jgi:hypothetical protein
MFRMTRDHILVSPQSSACLKSGAFNPPVFRPSDLGDTARRNQPAAAVVSRISVQERGTLLRAKVRTALCDLCARSSVLSVSPFSSHSAPSSRPDCTALFRSVPPNQIFS